MGLSSRILGIGFHRSAGGFSGGGVSLIAVDDKTGLPTQPLTDPGNATRTSDGGCDKYMCVWITQAAPVLYPHTGTVYMDAVTGSFIDPHSHASSLTCPSA